MVPVFDLGVLMRAQALRRARIRRGDHQAQIRETLLDTWPIAKAARIKPE